MRKRHLILLATVTLVVGGLAWMPSAGAADVVVSIAHTVADEHDGTASLTLTLSEPATEEVTVRYVTREVTAVAGIDYVPSLGTVVFAPGEQQQTIEVELIDDLVIEPTGSEELRVRLTEARGAVIGDPQARVLIYDDDAEVSVFGGTVDEAAGTFTFKLALAGYVSALDPELPDRGFAVDYALVDGSATAGADYVAATGTVTFDELTERLTITILDDQVAEPEESFDIVLSNPQNLTIARGLATVTITDDD